MKKIFNYIMLAAVALTGLTLTACSEDDALSTNQFGEGVSLNAYGPQPVMRGGYLRFIGSNLDQIREVQIPGVAPITQIELVKPGVPSEIRIVVPKDGPEPGLVTLVTKTDQKIVTKTALTYEEPIVFEEMTESAMPGQEIEIKGDYLNLIHMVEFADGVQVSETKFTAHDRYTIKVIVPEEARSGKINLLTADLSAIENPDEITYNIIPTDIALIVGTPTVAKLETPRGNAEALGVVDVKQGETLTISGDYLGLVAAVKFGESETPVKVEEFTLSEDKKTLTVVVPAEAPDGIVNLEAKSGVDIPVGTIITVIPTNCAANPYKVKNGQSLTITGKDLDVVAWIELPNVDGAVEFIAESAEKLVITEIPESAQEGGIKLCMQNGKSIEVDYTLVKPVIDAYDNNPVNAGGALTITGQDLDLVKSIAFDCDPVEVKVSADGTSMTCTVPMEAVSGAPTLNLKNGSTVKAIEITIEEAVFCYAVALPSAEEEIHAGDVMKLEVKNVDKLTGVEINGSPCQYIVSGNFLLIGVPENAKKKSQIRLISSNGEVTYTYDFIPNTEVKTVIWSGMNELGWSGEGQVYIGSDGGQELIDLEAKAGDELCIKFTILADDWCFQLWEGHWGQMFGEYKAENYDLAGNNGCFYLTLTDELIATFTTQQWWGGMLLVQGQQLIVTELSLIQHFSLETTLWEGEAIADDWGNQPFVLSDAGAELAEYGAKPGQTVNFYITPIEDGWKLEILEGHWGPSYGAWCAPGEDTEGGKFTEWNLAANGGKVSITLTQEMLDAAYTQQWWGGVFVLNGDNVKCTKVTIE